MVQVPRSPSSPCVWGDKIFLTTFADNELQTRCYRREDGALAWSRGVKTDKLEMYHRTESSPAAASPATDGERLVSYFGSFGLVCHDLNGKELWRHALPVALSLRGVRHRDVAADRRRSCHCQPRPGGGFVAARGGFAHGPEDLGNSPAGLLPEILHQADFGDRIYATPALAEDNLYLRTRTTLYAFGSGAAASKPGSTGNPD